MWRLALTIQDTMNRLPLVLLTFLTLNTFAQNNPTQDAQPIVAEGKLLYQSEMASWYGTDLFISQYKDMASVGGYFSYVDNDTAKCVFFSNAESPKVKGTITFDSTYNVNTANIDIAEREFTAMEHDLYVIRQAAMNALSTNEDGFFKFYQNTNPNLIPLIQGEERKVYVLTGTPQSGMVIFGNDYLLTFDQDNELTSKKQLHQNIIPTEYGNLQDGKQVTGALHSHLPETGNFITATDICTLMLYSKFTKWKSYNVVSEILEHMEL